MFTTIADSYKLFLRNFPVIFLYALPLLAVASADIYFEGLNSANRGAGYFIAAAVIIIPLVSAATDIAIYKRLLKMSAINPFNNLKTYVLYLVTQLLLGLIAVVPVFMFRYMLEMLNLNDTYALTTSLFLNLFIGIYFLARFNIILPLIVQGKIPTVKDFVSFTERPYHDWLYVVFLVYLPYILLNYLVSCPYMHMVVTNLYMFVFVCFNITFLLSGKPLPVLVNQLRREPVMTRAQEDPDEEPETKQKPAKKPETKKKTKKSTPKSSVKPNLEPALN